MLSAHVGTVGRGSGEGEAKDVGEEAFWPAAATVGGGGGGGGGAGGVGGVGGVGGMGGVSGGGGGSAGCGRSTVGEGGCLNRRCCSWVSTGHHASSLE